MNNRVILFVLLMMGVVLSTGCAGTYYNGYWGEPFYVNPDYGEDFYYDPFPYRAYPGYYGSLFYYPEYHDVWRDRRHEYRYHKDHDRKHRPHHRPKHGYRDRDSDEDRYHRYHENYPRDRYRHVPGGYRDNSLKYRR